MAGHNSDLARCSRHFRFFLSKVSVFIELTSLKIYHRYMGQNITKHFRDGLIYRSEFLSESRPARGVPKLCGEFGAGLKRVLYRYKMFSRVSAFSGKQTSGFVRGDCRSIGDKEPVRSDPESTRLVTLFFSIDSGLLDVNFLNKWHEKLPSHHSCFV
jgi:hypothetical protein